MGLAGRTRLLIGLGACPLLLHLALVSNLWTRLMPAPGAGRVLDWGVIAASGVPYAVIYLGLLAGFGATLRPGRDALITALARRMYGAIPAEMVVYTRRVTWAWCGFFAAQLLTSLALFLFAPLAVWSFFVNVLNLPLIALMFVAEHLCRPFLLRDAPRHSLAEMFRMMVDVTRSLWPPRSG